LNLSLDPWPSVELTLSLNRKPKRISRLLPTGKWTPLPKKNITQKASKLHITSPIPLDTLDLATFKIEIR
ncbi:MAG: hypothetical protein FWD53_09160, partial [Phycisphaerales bacterium]|nr:hypothetical protein [Phycisphaerales bacterium]